ncbi:hypothetical protein CONLIGDRAFT_269892 [Coniochaeta ligniaria NRRL 30616]|uniref:Secreted protein n=1 Tax=Coniochaeta ligniaria NRRL 30616 TaxID=1408157 RepID=A0A1J7JXB4_9PEZI|nr:hypothetical protein CONLIGDRAFT_269892 [Coniochaeta ligniaria NRRL 30616]
MMRHITCLTLTCVIPSQVLSLYCGMEYDTSETKHSRPHVMALFHLSARYAHTLYTWYTCIPLFPPMSHLSIPESSSRKQGATF